MTITNTVSDSKIRKLIEELFKLSGNPYSKEKVKQSEGYVKKGRFSVKTARGEVKMAEYFLEHNSGSSSDLTKFTGVTISQMSAGLSPQGLGLVYPYRDQHHSRSFIYRRIANEEELSTYINLMNKLIKEMEKIVK